MTTQRAYIITCNKCRAGHLIDYPLGKDDNGNHAVEPIVCRECKNILTEDQRLFFKRVDLFLKNWKILQDKYKNENYKEFAELLGAFFSLIST